MVSGRVVQGDPARRAEQADATSPSGRSLRGLDSVNFLMADVRDGVGPYISVFLAGRDWQAGPIGIALAASNIAAALFQIPAGLMVDSLRIKRALIAAAALLVGLGCVLIVFYPSFWTVIAAQSVLGAASAVIPPAIAALSLGIVGRRLLPGRVSRNESFNHLGSFAAAALAGVLGTWLGVQYVFYLVAMFAAASAAAVLLINPAEVDRELARGGEGAENAGEPIPFRQLLANRSILVFIASVALFHFGNAAMLPMAGQVMAESYPDLATAALSACIIAAQLVMVGVAWGVGRAMQRGIGRKPIFLVALAILPVRGVLFSLTDNPYAVVAIQLLDGVAAGIFGVIAVVIASDLTKGTGRFNLVQGLTALATGVGAAASNLLAGYVVQGFGFTVGFLTLAAIAACALAFFALLMPETGTGETGDEGESGGAVPATSAV